jgi:hypothetical protein
MAFRFPPAAEAELVTWSNTFKTKITAAATTYGLTAAQATAYGTKHDAFVAAYNVAQDNETRSPANISTKNVAKASLIAEIRMLAGVVQRWPNITNPLRIELGLPPRDFEPTPIPPPAAAPGIVIKSAQGRTVRIRLFDVANPTRRGKPAGVLGASVFSYVGASAPADLSDWKFEGNTGRTSVDVVFPATVASGAVVWLTAFWFNPRKQSGPACDPVSANLPGGGVMAEAA